MLPETSRDPELTDARATERLGSYIATTWQRREYMWYVARQEMRSRQINSFLGNLWHLLNPLLQISVFFLFFGLVLDTTRGVDNFLAYLSIGVFVYGYSQKCAMTGAKSLVKYRGLIQIVAFPRATLPLTTTLTEALATLPAYAVMLIMTAVTGEPPQWSWLLVIPFFALQTGFGAGLAFITARATSHVPDVQQVLPFLFRLGFYFSGVLFNVNAYVEGKSYELLFRLNPFYCFLEIYRGALIETSSVDWELFWIASGWTVALLCGGFWWFRRAEDSYGES